MTTEGQEINTLYNVFMVAAAVVFGIVSFLIVWSIIRYRRRGDELPKQIHGNNKLELAWTILPLLLVFFLFAATINAQTKVEHQAARPRETVQVTAFQWSWRFHYQQAGIDVVGGPNRVPEMVVPVNQPIHIRLVSADVVHAFWVPRTRYKRQAIPGYTNEFDMTFVKTGDYLGQCTQFCGLAHDQMLFRVRVVPDQEYQQWATSTRTATASASGS